MYNVAANHTSRDAQTLPSIELYPLKDNPRIQLLPGIHKSHIQGILFKLGILKSHGTQIRIEMKKIEDCNLDFNGSPFQIVRNQRGSPQYKTVELALRTTDLDDTKFDLLTIDDMTKIRSIRQEYLEYVNTLGEEEEETPEPVHEETPEPMEVEEETPEPMEVEEETSSKRPRSVSDDENSKPKTRKVELSMRNSTHVIHVPKNHDIITKHNKKKLIKKANQVEAVEKENSELKAKNAELENRNADIQELISEIGKQLTSTKEDTKKEIEEGKCLVSELSRMVKELQSQNKTLHHTIEEKDKRIQKLEKELEENEEAIAIGIS